MAAATLLAIFAQKAAVYWQLSFYVANAAGNDAADSSAF
jgi:hypothetical protein